MTNNELLLSISDLIDTKLKPIDDRTKELYPMLESIKKDQVRMDNSIKQNHLALKSEINQVQTGLKSVQVTLESEIKPRLDTIESCYLATYRRYIMGAEELDALKADMKFVKLVLAEHSEKIKGIS